ncbi:MAG: ArnT family glycosyltransferase [Armatimonadota bacterium]
MQVTTENSPGQTSCSQKWLIVWVLALFAFAGALYLARLGATPLRVNAEIRTYEITRNMIERGDYIVPVFREETRFNKPPFYYWCSIAVSRLAGNFGLATHRLPSVLSAFGVLGLGLVWARILRAEKETLLGLTILAVTYLFLVQARRGSFEVLLSFLCNASLLAFYLSKVRKSFRWALAGGILWGLAFLTKGSPALLFVPLVLAAWLWGQSSLTKIFRRELLPVVIVGVFIAMSWYAYILVFRPDSRSDILGEVLLPLGIKAGPKTTAEHRAPFYFYALGIWRAGFPLSIFLPLTIWHMVKHKLYPAASPLRLFALTMIIPFLIFSVIPMKQDHYLLPAYLPWAILTGLAIHDAVRGIVGFSRKWVTVPVALASVLLLVAGFAVGIGTYMVFESLVYAVLAGTLLIATAGATLWLVRTGRSPQAIVALAFSTWVLFGWYFVWMRPIEDGFGSGALFSSPSYNAQYWEAKIQRYPILGKLLDYDRGLKKAKKASRGGAQGVFTPSLDASGEE